MTTTQDKVFNLQLHVQKLEEELSVYRNGTTGAHLYELVLEKDEEIANLKEMVSALTKGGDDLKKSLEDKVENLRKLAKGSSEVLARCKELETQKAAVESQLADLQQDYRLLSASADEKTRMLEEKNNEIQLRDDALESLAQEMEDRDVSIEKLQARCAAVVADNASRTRAIERERSEWTIEGKELREEIEKGIQANKLLKERLTQVLASNKSLHQELKDQEQRTDMFKADLHKERDAIRSLTQTLTQCRAQLQETLTEKGEIIVQLQEKIERLQQQFKNELGLRDESFRRELAQRDEIIKTLTSRLGVIQDERENFHATKRQLDAANGRIADLEYKLRGGGVTSSTAFAHGNAASFVPQKMPLSDRTNTSVAGTHVPSHSLPPPPNQQFAPTSSSSSSSSSYYSTYKPMVARPV